MSKFQKKGRNEIQKILSREKLFTKFENLCLKYLNGKIEMSNLLRQIKNAFGRKNYNKILNHLPNYLPKDVQEDLQKAFSKGKNVQISKAMTYLLRHGGRREGLNIDDEGFVFVEEFLQHRKMKRSKLSFEKIKEIVETNDKKRFALELDIKTQKWKIRANQGHSIKIKKLDIKLITKCDICVHGTYYKALNLIKKSGGLSRMGRQHIHMAIGLPGEKGVISGMRHNCQVLIYIDVDGATKDGFKFYQSSNNVILCEGNEKGFLPMKYFKKVVDAISGKEIN